MFKMRFKILSPRSGNKDLPLLDLLHGDTEAHHGVYQGKGRDIGTYRGAGLSILEFLTSRFLGSNNAAS
jgi:hypothetical protein